ncbi:branched-chain amino acid ABC transporter permease [Noviherbaspirillum saxi]|uniref:Branched-chain amino acid ABC transporter permease n=1 Tax=Noviherbaspirillum saxi TaxID=2320863 RepID=A0A3A3FVR6_9BURK|nr:branched-chain amino acid ABC transporter permease [Noviherbaspirillum saxi]RJF98231.1 branched-chain amino acid ABC transporter permease [Noviherbaspirillum saxi]
MNQELFFLAILDGLSYAALLFLVALGITLVFGVMNIINMAHGGFFAIGGYAAASVGIWAAAAQVSPLWSFIMLPLVAIAVGALFGGLMETCLMRRIYDKDPVLQLLITFAAFMIFEDLQRMIWGTQPYSVSEIVNYLGVAEVMGITYTYYQLLVLPGVALVVFFALRYFLRRSLIGRQVVAVAHHREVATAMGINVKRICLLTFIAGSALGALGGALAVQTTSWVAGIGAEMIVLSFAVVATAGLGQIEGALIAAIMIGLARAFSVYLLPELEVLVPYLIMTLVLLFRPQGLFSVAKARRV